MARKNPKTLDAARPLSCVLYIRVSTKLQVEKGESIDAQRFELTRYAENHGMRVLREYVDAGFSGKNVQGRPQFRQMMDDIIKAQPSKRPAYVLVFKLSRFGRNAADTWNSLQTLQDYGVELCCVKDGTKTMVEMTAMCNYTGLVPDVIGGHGPKTAPGTEGVKELNELFKLKEDGGILNKHGVVEYVNGIAPGVFVTVSTPNEEIAYQMQYHSMGPGPLWTLYRPYHLCNLETPLSVAKAVIDGEVTCVAKDGLVAECITRAKIDLKAGQTIDGIGGYTTHGSICSAEEANEKGYVPFGLVTNKAVMKKDVKKGTLITYDMIDLDKTTLIYQLRKEQDAMYGRYVL